MNNTHLKHILVTIALLSTTLAHSASSASSNTPESSTMIPWKQGMRVRHYESERNAMTHDGYILICPSGMDTGRGGKCLDTTKQNAWQHLDSVTPPGMRILGIDYRLSGSGGYRSMFVYYVLK